MSGERLLARVCQAGCIAVAIAACTSLPTTPTARTGSGGSGDVGGQTGAGGTTMPQGSGGKGSGGAAPGAGAGGMMAGAGGSGAGGTITSMDGSPDASAGDAPATGGATGTGGAPGVGGATGTGGAGGGVSVVGCADGSREAFVSITNFPSIAGCAGGWSVAGVLSMASMTPACNRAAGNDGTRPTGDGCSVADLCAVGWHVCGGANELDSLNATCAQAGIPAATAMTRVLYVTRQRGVTGITCNANDMIGTNDVHGCGNFGLAEDPNCAPLNAQFSQTECDEVPPWACAGTLTEGLSVTKSGPTNGGVLCCK